MPGFVAAVLSWIIPGLGYALSRQYARGFVAGVTIAILFTLGLLIGGVRVVQIPASFRGPDVLQQPWFIPQSMAGPGAVAVGIVARRIETASTAQRWDVGTLYTAIAGLLNLLVIMDSAWRAERHHSPPASNAAQPPAREGGS